MKSFIININELFNDDDEIFDDDLIKILDEFVPEKLLLICCCKKYINENVLYYNKKD